MSESKLCNYCDILKSFDSFTNNKRYKDGKENKCKECFKVYLSDKKDKVQESQKKWREKNPDYMKEYNKSDKRKEYAKNYYIKNVEKISYYSKIQRLKDPNLFKERRRNYVINNREKVLEYHREWKTTKRKDDILYKLKENTSRRIRYELHTLIKGKKTKRTYEYLGCSIEELQTHLESKFDTTMSWDNYGTIWHIDHIIPCAAWNLEDDFENMCCWNFRNLQPLLSHLNQSKRDKYNIIDKENYVNQFNCLNRIIEV
jgi:hypothetical protein